MFSVLLLESNHRLANDIVADLDASATSGRSIPILAGRIAGRWGRECVV